MKIENLLLEAISPIVYHFTNLNNLEEIISTNKLELSPGGFTKDVEAAKSKKGYYLSTSRTRTGGFHVNKNIGALIKLDGRKLSNNFSGGAEDYFSPSMRNANPTSFEQEDRIYSDKPEISNIFKYILGIDIVLSGGLMDGDRGDIYKKLAFKAYTFGKKFNIPVRIYTNNRDFISGSNNYLKGDDLKSLNVKLSDKNTKRIDNRRKLSDSDLKDLKFIFKTLKFDTPEKLDPEELSRVRNYLRYYQVEENNPSGLITTLHNVTSTKESRNILNKIYNIMRNYGIRNINPKTITKAIYLKWNTILSES